MRTAERPALRLPRTQRSFRRPIAVSAAVHAALGLLVLWVIGAADADVPVRAGPPGPAGGGAAVRYMELPAYRPPRVTDPTAAAIQPIPPEPRVEIKDVAPALPLADVSRVQFVRVPISDPSLAPGGAALGGGVQRSGGPGGGAGAGPGTGGAGGEIFPPQARYSILPPLPRPASVRGRTFRVHFWVDAAGRVRRVAVTPPIPDAGYAKQFIALMSQYTFTPALEPDGTPTSGETVLTITL
jgi:hypothetical protein